MPAFTLPVILALCSVHLHWRRGGGVVVTGYSKGKHFSGKYFVTLTLNCICGSPASFLLSVADFDAKVDRDAMGWLQVASEFR